MLQSNVFKADETLIYKFIFVLIRKNIFSFLLPRRRKTTLWIQPSLVRLQTYKGSVESCQERRNYDVPIIGLSPESSHYRNELIQINPLFNNLIHLVTLECPPGQIITNWYFPMTLGHVCMNGKSYAIAFNNIFCNDPIKKHFGIFN